MGKIAPISLHVNPDVDAHTHPYISTGLKENKFGVSVNEAREVYKLASNATKHKNNRDGLPHRLTAYRITTILRCDRSINCPNGTIKRRWNYIKTSRSGRWFRV